MSTTTAPHPRDAARRRSRRDVPARLGRYFDDPSGLPREIICLPGAGGSTLVIDRDAVTLGNRRLVAHLAADEPPANARLIGSLYLADENRGRCRRVRAEDLEIAPATGCLCELVEGAPRTRRRATAPVWTIGSRRYRLVPTGASCAGRAPRVPSESRDW